MPDIEQEFACPCCGLYAMSAGMRDLDAALHAEFGERLRRSSGSRCPKYNASPEIRGSDTSAHLPIWGENGKETVGGDYELLHATERDRRRLAWIAVREGALGVGYMPDDNAIHVDRKPRRYGLALWKVKNGKTEYFF